MSGPAHSLPRINWSIPAVAGLVLLLLTLHTLAAVAPLSAWGDILAGHPPGLVEGLVFSQVALPRIVMSWLVGAALGLAGLLFQQALRNPLADPAIIGVSSGAYLALAAAMLYAPWLLSWGSEAVALAGGAGACALVAAVAWRSAGMAVLSLPMIRGRPPPHLMRVKPPRRATRAAVPRSGRAGPRGGPGSSRTRRRWRPRSRRTAG